MNDCRCKNQSFIFPIMASSLALKDGSIKLEFILLKMKTEYTYNFQYRSYMNRLELIAY